MKSITIHGLDDYLDKRIKEKAESEGTSINKTIKKLLALNHEKGQMAMGNLGIYLRFGLKTIKLSLIKRQQTLKKFTLRNGNEKSPS